MTDDLDRRDAELSAFIDGILTGKIVAGSSERLLAELVVGWRARAKESAPAALRADLIDTKSLREWLSSWGDGPNWSDKTGATVPIAKSTLRQMLDNLDEWDRVFRNPELSPQEEAAIDAAVAVESAPAASPEPGDDEDRRHLVRVAARRASREDESATAVSPEPGASSGESTTNKEQTMNEPILQFFAYEHLPPKLQAVSRSFCELARAICGVEASMPAGTSTEFPLPRNPERTVALRKLLEAKDAAVRAALFKDAE